MSSLGLRPRFAASRLLEALVDSPAVLVHGPRQCGKTTLVQTVCTARGADRAAPLASAPTLSLDYEYLSFDDAALSEAADADPNGFIADLPQRVVLDEVQRVPGVFTAIKLAIDRQRSPGRFVLTGSTNVLLLPALSDSLAGRLQIIRLRPLSQFELHTPTADAAWDSPRAGFIDALFGGGFSRSTSERLRAGLAARLAGGGYPAALERPPGRRQARWYADYVETLVQRDVRDLTRISRLDAVPRLLEAAAAQTAQLFNVSRLAAPFQLSLPTIRSYMTLLERLFLVEPLPPWHASRLKRIVKSPKLHMCDTGLACALLGAGADALQADRQLLGQILETFVVGELRRQAGWHDAPLRFSHFRDRDGAEVDIVVERGVAQVAGIEVKAAATVAKADFRGLRKLAAAAGDRFTSGVVLYDGERSAAFGDGMRAVPLRQLWEAL